MKNKNSQFFAIVLVIFTMVFVCTEIVFATESTEIVSGEIEVNKRVEKFTLNNQKFYRSGAFLEKSKKIYKISEVYNSGGKQYYLLRLKENNVGVGWVDSKSVEFVNTFVSDFKALNDVAMVNESVNKFSLPNGSEVLKNSFYDTNYLKGQVLRVTDELSTKANDNYALLRSMDNVGVGWVEKNSLAISPKQVIKSMVNVNKYGIVIKGGKKHTIPHDNLNIYMLDLSTNYLLNKEVKIFSEVKTQNQENYSLIGISSPICWVKSTDLEVFDTFIYGKETLKSAHRGFTLDSPENTLASIQSASKNGFDLVEIDVQKTKDNQLVLMHDSTVDRTTNGKGKVADKTLSEIKNLNINMAGFESVAQQKIPTLEQALKEISNTGLGVNIDGSKMDLGNAENLNRIVTMLKAYDLYSKSFFVLDEPARSLALKEHPELPVTFTTNGESTLDQDIAALKQYRNGFYSTAYVYLTDNLIQKLKNNNIPLHVYAVRNQQEYEYCKEIGARFIETDNLVK